MWKLAEKNNFEKSIDYIAKNAAMSFLMKWYGENNNERNLKLNSSISRTKKEAPTKNEKKDRAEGSKDFSDVLMDWWDEDNCGSTQAFHAVVDMHAFAETDGNGSRVDDPHVDDSLFDHNIVDHTIVDHPLIAALIDDLLFDPKMD
eukprot:CAMPEP_0113329932 /NCGR_PEP_ID=MMETSP0010_2-20120614/21255_1 /TAXON_ID=216773 ORGANISM="Corethron hystrix, Strain 308" /NCGR_SAMPLE_ID=MMETSP0010_2 /ASSEMBLY_ACC=CAM_ASM_000155 /LENGTH=145 /DNA_ID=CAMNT_0000192237 /DNA_START=93 /DNA_END=528 /DNA_ORIENTATION=- /assembly_acc=CAM_ASM_000155